MPTAARSRVEGAELLVEDAHDDHVDVPLAVVRGAAAPPLDDEAEVLVEGLCPRVRREDLEPDAMQTERLEREAEHELDRLGPVATPPIAGAHRKTQLGRPCDPVDRAEHDLPE